MGQHADGYIDKVAQPTAIYLDFYDRWLDAAFANFGTPDTSRLRHGSAIGGYGEIPRLDGGFGCDHRQILVDMQF